MMCHLRIMQFLAVHPGSSIKNSKHLNKYFKRRKRAEENWLIKEAPQIMIHDSWFMIHDGWPQFFGRARDQVLKFKLRTKSHVNVTLPPLLKRAFRKYTITVTMHSILFSTYLKPSIWLKAKIGLILTECAYNALLSHDLLFGPDK